VNWKWADRKDDHYVTFRHQEQRVAALEADFLELSKLVLTYIEADMACSWLGSAKNLSEALRSIIKKREAK